MRLTPAEELELRWYVEEADASFGLRSPFGIQLELAESGQLFDRQGTADPEPRVLRSLGAARRARRIRDRLRRMGRQAAAVLVAGYCLEPPKGCAKLGRLAAIAALTSSARAAYQRAHRTTSRPRTSSVGRWIGQRLKSDIELRAAVLLEADIMLTEAVRLWRNRTTVG